MLQVRFFPYLRKCHQRVKNILFMPWFGSNRKNNKWKAEEVIVLSAGLAPAHKPSCHFNSRMNYNLQRPNIHELNLETEHGLL